MMPARAAVGRMRIFNDLEDSFLRRISNVQEMISRGRIRRVIESIRQKRNVHNEPYCRNYEKDERCAGERSVQVRKESEEMQRRETNFFSRLRSY